MCSLLQQRTKHTHGVTPNDAVTQVFGDCCVYKLLLKYFSFILEMYMYKYLSYCSK